MQRIIVTIIIILTTSLALQGQANFGQSINTPHYLVVLPNPIADLDEVGTIVTKYMINNDKTAKLVVSKVKLSNQRFYIIKGFENQQTASQFYQQATDKVADFTQELISAAYFYIAEPDLRVVLKEQNFDSYLTYWSRTNLGN